jgi:FkbM family methyltransferase
MKGGAQLGRALPRPLVRGLRRVLHAAYWSKAVGASLLARDRALPAGALDCVVARNEHGVYCVPRSSRSKHEARRIIQSRVWEPETIELLRGLDPSGDIVHAGTFFGDFLPALARSRQGGALVWGFEPNRESYRCALITTMLNDLPNVVLTHAALGAQGGHTAILMTANRAGVPTGGASRVLKDRSLASGLDTEEVDLVSIDEAIGAERSVAVIQLDLEGHEQQALAGAMDTIRRCRPVLVLEQAPSEGWLQANLAPLGYRREGAVCANTVLRCR